MPIIATTGRKALRVRLLIAALYLVLGAGSLSMLYPFALMLANSVTSAADYEEFRLVPRYWHDDKALFKKFIYDKIWPELLGYEYAEPWRHAFDIKAAQLGPLLAKDDGELDRIAADWREFLPSVPALHKFAYYTHSATWAHNYTLLDLTPRYHAWLKRRFGDVAALNRDYVDNAASFEDVSLPYEDPMRQRWLLPIDKKYLDWRDFKATLPPQQVRVASAESVFQKFLAEKYPLPSDLAAATGGKFSSNFALTLPLASAGGVLPKAAMEEFVRKKCPVIFLKLDVPACERRYRDFMAAKRRGPPEPELKALCPMGEAYPGEANDWIEFMETCELGVIGFHDPLFQYQDFLRAKFKDAAAMDAAYGWDAKDFREVRLPVKWVDVHTFRQERPRVFWTYLTGNYKMVLEMMAVHGRAMLNTLVYIVLAILGALTVNPLAAYALSRYRLRHTNKILLFLLATMAFPASVGMIPSFLMLKDFGMLNTFAALILPGLANGFSIFLLKGFFDSLPQELYEAALIDGASELTIFLRMALPMTKPILAILALGAFSSAYGSFMFAFLTCQDPSMWTLMVFLYEFQQNYPNYLVMASLVVSAIPTLVVFVFCQNIILRGIVVPSFK